MAMTPTERKTALMERGVTQAQIARATGVSGPMVSQVLAGLARSGPVEREIARAIGRPEREVFAKPRYRRPPVQAA